MVPSRIAPPWRDRGVHWRPREEWSMQGQKLSRRDALRAMGAVTAASAFDWPAVARAAHEAHAAARSAAAGAPPAYTLLGAADAADLEALTSQIIPSDDTPGVRDAWVTFFIDLALGSFFAHWRPGFMEGFADFHAAVCAVHPHVASFLSFTSERQIDFL